MSDKAIRKLTQMIRLRNEMSRHWYSKMPLNLPHLEMSTDCHSRINVATWSGELRIQEVQLVDSMRRSVFQDLTRRHFLELYFQSKMQFYTNNFATDKAKISAGMKKIDTFDMDAKLQTCYELAVNRISTTLHQKK